MNNSGITSQYGFLFQRKVFILYILENVSAKQRFCFEGKDDIEISNDEKIFSLYDTPSNCVQVKSGVVDNACFNKIIGNWLLQDSDTYTLFIENELGFIWSITELINSVIDFVKKGKGQKKTAIAKRVYDQYANDIEKNEAKQLKENVSKILNMINIDKSSNVEMDKRIEDIFFEHHCQDIIEYELAKKKRLEKFIQYINLEIDDSIKEKRTYSLIFSELMKILTAVCDEISDHKYVANVGYLKNSFKGIANKIVDERKQREVKQLFLVNDTATFVVEGIVNELFYKDFREIYVDKKQIEVENLEEFAKENYNEALFEIDGECKPKNSTVYKGLHRVTV